MKKELKTDTKITYQEYKKILKLFPSLYLKKMSIISIAIILLFSVTLLPPDPMPFLDFLLVAVVFILLVAFILKIIDLLFRKLKYKRFFNNDLDSIDYTLSFYEDYLEKVSENETTKIKYSYIKTIKETDTNFYILLKNKRRLVIVKNNCSSELITFIRNISVSNGKNNSKNIKGYISEEDPKHKKIRRFLMILFILTLLSVHIGVFLWGVIMQYLDIPPLLFNEYLWIMYFCLPVPITSIILGFIYKGKGFKCTKNIVAGFIMASFIMMIGLFSFIPMYDEKYEENYEEIYTYEEMFGINLPENIKYNKISWDTSYLKEHTSHRIFLTSDEDVENVSKQISNIYLKQDEISTHLKAIMPTDIFPLEPNDSYYLVYIKDLDKYNECPTKTGNYHIYTIMFTKDTGYIQIDNYIYMYKE